MVPVGVSVSPKGSVAILESNAEKVKIEITTTSKDKFKQNLESDIKREVNASKN
jgi:hypothetical protein